MFVLTLTLVLSLLSFSTAAPTTHNCSQLTKPLTAKELHQILGGWIFIEGFSNNDFVDSFWDNIGSMRMMFNTTADNNTLLLSVAIAGNDPVPEKVQCLRNAQNVSITGGKPLEIHLEPPPLYYRFLQTCPDCLVMYMFTKENDYRAFALFGRNTTPAASDLETFRKQAACLHFPQPAKFQYDTNKGICPW